MSDNALTRFKVTYAEVALEQPLLLGTDDTLENDLILEPTENYLVLPVTEEQYTKLLSAALNGANRFYPEEYLEVIYPLIKAGKIMFCSQVADCITNDESVKNALSNYLAENGYGVPTDGVDTTVGSDNPNNSDNLLTDCDPDQIAGQCIAMVEELNRIAIDWIEGMVAFTLPAEFAGYLAQSNPISAGLGVDWGDLVDWTSDEVLSQYEGAYDTALRNEAACLLYSKACVDCELTMDDVLDAFTSQVSIGLNPADTWKQLIADIVTLSVGDQIVYGVWSLICGTWKIGAMFTGISGLQTLKYAMQHYTATDPSTIGCDDCLDCLLPLSELMVVDEPLSDCVISYTGTYSGNTAGKSCVQAQGTGGTVYTDVNIGLDETVSSVTVSVAGRATRAGGSTVGHTWVFNAYNSVGTLVDQWINSENLVTGTWYPRSHTLTGTGIVRVLSSFQAVGFSGALKDAQQSEIQLS